MAGKNKGKAKPVAQAARLLEGAWKHLGGTATIRFQGRQQTPQDIENDLQAMLDLREAVRLARGVLAARLHDEEAALPALLTRMEGLVEWVRATFGGEPDVLADFGLAPRKTRRALTVEERAVANAKRKATRKARGIVPKKERLAIKGDVVAVTLTPLVAEPVT